MTKEPTVILAAISELIRQIVPLLIIFGFIHWSGEQVAQFMVVVGVSITLISTLLNRNQVVPKTVVDEQIKTAIAMPPTATVEQVVDKVNSK